MRTKVVVTGGAGFIGSHLAEALVEKGYDVHVVDNLVAGKREHVPSGATLHETDIRDSAALAPIFQGAKFVFHLAALPRVEPSIRDPRSTHDVNVTGTLNVLVAARDTGVTRVVYSTTCAVYGDHDVPFFHEKLSPRPLSPYALQKYEGELQCALFSKLYGLETIALRYCNVYGSRASTEGAYALLVGKFLAQRSRGEALTIVPDGTQSRDFVHVADVARANLLAAESPGTGKGEAINIGSGEERSVLAIADLIGGPRMFTEPRLEPKHFRADITRARDLLGWQPEVRFEDGIAELKMIYGVA